MFILNLFWRVVFWWKKRTGWLDLDRQIEVTGEVLAAFSARDGDRNFDLRVDPEHEVFITAFGGRLTHDVGTQVPSLHCEVVPWSSDELKSRFDALRAGDRVRVRGAWGYDGVHVGTNMVLEALMALFRHQPNMKGGWFEIHPVESIEKL